MKKTIKKYLDLPFEEGKTYSTKMGTGEKFTIHKIIMVRDQIIRLDGVYENSPHLKNCPLPPDRLIPDRVEDGTVEVCDKCGSKI